MKVIHTSGFDRKLMEMLAERQGRIDGDLRGELRRHLLAASEKEGATEEEKEATAKSIDSFLDNSPNIFVMSARSIIRALETAERASDQTADGIIALAKAMNSPQDIFLMGGIATSVANANSWLREAQHQLLKICMDAEWRPAPKKGETP